MSHSKPQAKVAPKPHSEAAPKAALVAASPSMLDKTLGEILLAGMARLP
jgi:hypothetical protein